MAERPRPYAVAAALILGLSPALLASAQQIVAQPGLAHEFDSLPLYPPQRDSEAPTARRVFELFEPTQGQRFDPDLDSRRQLILDLLDISPREFSRL